MNERPRGPDGAALARSSHPSTVPAEILSEVAAGGASDAGGLPVELLGNFLAELAAAVVAGQPISRRDLRAYRSRGDAAAKQGVALRALLDLYLSSAWRLWRHLPPVAQAARSPSGVVTAGEVMLHAVDDVVAALAEGYQLARRALVRAQVSARREFVDDLLAGAVDVASVLQRAEGFGLDLSGPHAVAVVQAERPFTDASPLIATLERAVQAGDGDGQALLASKQGRLVVIFPAPNRRVIDAALTRLGSALGRRPGDGAGVQLRRQVAAGVWQIGLGRAGSGADGVLASYREALDALELAGILGWDSPVIAAADLLVYRVLLRDRPALDDLVASTLTPLLSARGGAAALLDTLVAYFRCGTNSARTARELHVSVRAVSYRLDRVRDLTGLDPSRSEDGLALHVAALGAALLGWPSTGSARRAQSPPTLPEAGNQLP